MIPEDGREDIQLLRLLPEATKTETKATLLRRQRRDVMCGGRREFAWPGAANRMILAIYSHSCHRPVCLKFVKWFHLVRRMNNKIQKFGFDWKSLNWLNFAGKSTKRNLEKWYGVLPFCDFKSVEWCDEDVLELGVVETAESGDPGLTSFGVVLPFDLLSDLTLPESEELFETFCWASLSCFRNFARLFWNQT